MQTTPELAIRLQRSVFNQALANCDLGAIGAVLAPTAILVTGTDSALISGRKAQLATWKREFAATPRTIYTRTPETITASPIEPIAFEQGHWQGVYASGTELLASGTYTAKWRQFGAVWMIEAELFLTLA